ncbi:uncharacterized protein N7482_002726 [Penicillium canariense]|uniref:Uncharacterized protein n=1 Tax=Penicillium canariense TaxID=189055 RepID=A0A9W9IIA6_9EURO|nr:uncharacterized protein N7482_002726 [Penicillium canariense]KAJ5176849.1 hypothetical protein N7482_002726 [Penicillium canariense]
MTESHQMEAMFPHSGAAGRSEGNHVETERSMDPRTSLEDYNRTMLHYTQRQMSSFVDLDDGSGSGASSRDSQSSGNSSHSGSSSTGVLANLANGPPPTSASAAAATRHRVQQGQGQGPMRSPNEAKPSRY